MIVTGSTVEQPSNWIATAFRSRRMWRLLSLLREPLLMHNAITNLAEVARRERRKRDRVRHLRVPADLAVRRVLDRAEPVRVPREQKQTREDDEMQSRARRSARRRGSGGMVGGVAHVHHERERKRDARESRRRALRRIAPRARPPNARTTSAQPPRAEELSRARSFVLVRARGLCALERGRADLGRAREQRLLGRRLLHLERGGVRIVELDALAVADRDRYVLVVKGANP